MNTVYFSKFIEVNYLASLASSETKRYVPLNLCLQDMVYRRWNAQTTAPSTTRPSLPNLPKTGNSNMLPVVPSMPNPMEKWKELIKQRRTCCRRRVTLRKLFLHIDPHPCKVERARLNYYSAVRFDAPFSALQRLSNRASLRGRRNRVRGRGARGIGERGEGTPATRTPFASFLRSLANANF